MHLHPQILIFYISFLHIDESLCQIVLKWLNMNKAASSALCFVTAYSLILSHKQFINTYLWRLLPVVLCIIQLYSRSHFYVEDKNPC